MYVIFIYLFVLCYLCFCLLIFSILLFVVVNFVIAYSFFNLFHCSCSGSSMYFAFFFLVIRTLLFMCLCCHCLLKPYYSFVVITLYLFLFLFSLLTHCVSYSSYCHRYLSDLALVLLVWLLIPVWQQNFHLQNTKPILLLLFQSLRDLQEILLEIERY